MDEKLVDIRHPLYDDNIANWNIWRQAWEAGEDFLTSHLKKFSNHEDINDFEFRKDISYIPAYAKSNIHEIKNSIFQRMVDVVRSGGTESYQKAINGDELGVDKKGSTMNSFMGIKILPELLVMRKVGIYVDMPIINGKPTLRDAKGKRPYLYRYQAEEICSWNEINQDEYSAVLLKELVETSNSTFGLPDGRAVQYRYIRLNENGGITVTFYNEDGVQTGEQDINIPRIPFYVFEIEDSLMEELARYQIALMNLASSDMNYAFRSNYPIYTEQIDFMAENAYAKTGDLDQHGEPVKKAIKTGSGKGRGYPIGTDRPGFIHPSPEPLRASMEKQAQMKQEMRELVHLKVTEMGKRASADSKEMDTQGLEAGLSYIGSVMETGERKVESFWSMYEKANTIATITYPKRYNLKSDAQRLDESKTLKELKPAVPSKTFQKETSKLIAVTVLGNKVSAETIDIINKEVDKAIALSTDPKEIYQDVEIGLLAKEHAADLKGYPEDTVELAQKEHAERAKIIAISQTEGAGARGIQDMDPVQTQGKDEKKALNEGPDQTDKTRGENK